jgi:hypothetical protein
MIDVLLNYLNKEPLDEMEYPVYAQTVEVHFDNDDYELEGIEDTDVKDCLLKAINESDLRAADSLEIDKGMIMIRWEYPYPVEIICDNEVGCIADRLIETLVSEVYIRDIFFRTGEVVLRGYDKCNHDRVLMKEIGLLV